MRGLLRLLLVLMFLQGTCVFAQCPPNIGFETGDFTGWISSTGLVDKATGNITFDYSGSAVYGRQTIISRSESGTDTYGHFPTICPNGSNYSIRLGNPQTGAQAEQVSYTYKVPDGNASTLILNYAVVLQNPADHQDFEQPRFTVKVHDVTDGVDIACPYFDFVSSSSLPGFVLSDVAGSGANAAAVYYKDWASTTINLVGYSGKTVTLEFTTNDCSKGGHFGYAYLDIDQSCTAAISGNAYCNGQPALTLYAPTGFNQYIWYKGNDYTNPVGSGQKLTIKPAPPDLSKYSVIIIPYAGIGCVDTLSTVINKIEENYKLVVPDTVYGCKNTGADITASSITAGSSPNMTLSYYKDSLATVYLGNPQTLSDGTYYIKGVNPEGCLNVLPVHVKLHNLPVIALTDPPAVQYPRSIDLSRLFLTVINQTYGYYSDAAATIPLTNYKTIDVSGKYYIKSINEFGCEIISSVNITVTPPLPANVTAPNVFTPNNDGINDYFSVKVDGFVKFGSLKIFNRYGQLVFMAKSENDLWSGNYNNKALPPGTYYWIFEGTDQYYNTKVTKSASITIVR